MTAGDRPRIVSMTPLLVVSNLQRSMDFYCAKLGFAEPNAWGEPPCFAMMNRDGFELMLSVAEKPGQVHPHGAFEVWDFYVRVSDLAKEIAALEVAGVKLSAGPRDTFYSMREIEVTDPDGHRICFGQDIGDQPLAGATAYEATIEIGGKRLRLVLKLAAAHGHTMARLDSPDQGATNLMIDRFARDGEKVKFEMANLGVTYEGEFDATEKELTGTWSQRGKSWPVVFRRV